MSRVVRRLAAQLPPIEPPCCPWCLLRQALWNAGMSKAPRIGHELLWEIYREIPIRKRKPKFPVPAPIQFPPPVPFRPTPFFRNGYFRRKGGIK